MHTGFLLISIFKKLLFLSDIENTECPCVGNLVRNSKQYLTQVLPL